MAFKAYSYLFLCITFLLKFTEGQNLQYISSSIQPCYRDDPDLSGCLKRESNLVLKNFTLGVPQLGIPPTDPLVVADINVLSVNNLIETKLTNGVMYGLSNTYVEDVVIDTQSFTGYMHFKGNSTMDSVANTRGQFLFFPININGLTTTTFVNFDIKVRWDWGLVIKNNVTYTEARNHTTEFTYEDVLMDLHDSIDRSTIFGQIAESVLQNNRRFFIDQLGAPVRNEITNNIIGIMNKLFSVVPYDELLPKH